ncbi:MAG: hypothetical protein ACD_37C00575G0004 [uncultured bacterium]|nr:MAG: hypothetical protein ACD_37C00575G0004 [uncultured bacterium]KKP95896.1 MAG: Histidine triad (HIT) protein [Candidatus Levybacteria bacterium GW2011_GWA2_36_13]KKQ00351.1 MAG: Histidine triad (HIT) protein [Candidatus Levybacteria bacterium GW2011_GWB1_36_18]KKQ57919.1 MAG: histidine triad (HIT) protein, Hit-like protein involved in cell-cycle regulation [Microgenomates group bacterium GW2011_GWC1_38_14]OGH43530.1 MAG: hypothetical protein A3I49_02285 [Candidatus Levybacteria bacterium 
MKDCIFCKIRDGKIAKEFTYQDNDVMVFPDIHPIKPTHLLIMPKKHIEDLTELSDDNLLAKLKTVIQKMVEENSLMGKGYRIGINGGGAQIINHLHLHLMAPWGQNE